MKKLMIFLSVLVMIGLLGSMTVSADTLPLNAPEGVRIELQELAETDTPDSYVVVDHGETVLKVGHVAASGLTAALSDTAANGYYTADFLLPDSVSQVFLTGLTRDNIDEIEAAVIAGYADGSFELTDLGFIDAEKTLEEDGDDQLCWAAASANILTYTGWAAQAGFNNTDDLFELFINSFENKAGHSYYGVGWFFNGVKNPRADSSHPINYPDSGNYLPRYAFDDYTSSVGLLSGGADGLRQINEALRDGCGVALSTKIFKDGADMGGHAVTCWGFVTDTRYPDTYIAHYKSVIITDSDSDELSGVDRRVADNVMSCCALTPMVQDTGVDTAYFWITDTLVAVLENSVILQPYNASLTGETSVGATLDRLTTPDLTAYCICLADREETELTQTLFAAGSTIYYNPEFLNAGEVDFVGDFTINIKVVDRNSGATVYSKKLAGGNQTVASGYYLYFGDYAITPNLPVGDYTFTASVNDNRKTTEAYYDNNSRSIDFKVRETFLIGDVDGDDDVSSVDAAWIMRYAAGMHTEIDDLAIQRGDVLNDGELNILDATLIQRYNANIVIYYPINITGYYD